MAEPVDQRLVETKFRRKFERLWKDWSTCLNVMVRDKGGILICPTSNDLLFDLSERRLTATPKWPICFLNVPQKGNSSGRGHRLSIFIDGTFSFAQLPVELAAPQLVSVSSNIAFFKPNSEAGRTELALVEAYHFDHFNEDPKGSMPHPIFHAQRNIRPDTVFPKFQESLKSVPDNAMTIEYISQERKDALFGLKTFRLPTPQLDLFSLSAVVAADHLVDRCAHDSQEYLRFKALLKCIGHQDSQGRVSHIEPICADAAKADNRFVWQWYAQH
jgi:hypothetical protein